MNEPQVSSRHVYVAAKGIAIALGGVMAASGLTYLASVAAARAVGATQFGRYMLALSAAGLLAALALGAVDRGVLRYVAIYRQAGDADRERATIRAATTWTVVSSSIAAALLAAVAGPLAGLFTVGVGLVPLLHVVALAIPLVNLLTLFNAVTDASKDMRYRVITNDLLRNGSFLVLVAAGIVMTRITAGYLTWIYVVSHALAAGTALWVVRAYLLGAWRAAWSALSPVLKFSLPFLVAQGLNQAGAYTGIFLLGIMGSARDVGVFGAAAIIATGIGLILEAIIRVYAPMVAELVERKDLRETGVLLRHLTRWSIIWGGPLVALTIVFREPILTLLGNDYASGALALAVLAVGHAVNSGTGPIGVVLVMSGRAWLNALDLAIALVLRVGLGVWLIARYDTLGAAVATTAALVAINLLRVVQVGLTLGIWGYDSSSVRPAAATVAASAAAWLAMGAGSVGGAAGLILGFAVLLVTYVLCLLMFGLAPQDREILRVGLRKVRGWHGHVYGS